MTAISQKITPFEFQWLTYLLERRAVRFAFFMLVSFNALENEVVFVHERIPTGRVIDVDTDTFIRIPDRYHE